jgi:uncharacterized protein YecE (DUF72 family)
MSDSRDPSYDASVPAIADSCLRVGIAGWTYPDWKGLVFPRESNFDKLAYLSGFFDTVEINSSFYAVPACRETERWLRSVDRNPQFRFCVKLFKQFTHGMDIKEGSPELNQDSLSRFKESFNPMLHAGKLGALLIQFPYRFHWGEKTREYLSRLFDEFCGYPAVLEVRHLSFLEDAFVEFLGQKRVGFANIDQPQVSRSLPPTSILIPHCPGYLRFHGRNANNWFAENATVASRYDYDYSPEEFERYLGMVEKVKQKGGILYIIFNNHYRAQQIKNALEFLHRLTGQKVEVMPKLMEVYPSLRRIALHSVGSGETYPLF